MLKILYLKLYHNTIIVEKDFKANRKLDAHIGGGRDDYFQNIFKSILPDICVTCS